MAEAIAAIPDSKARELLEQIGKETAVQMLQIMWTTRFFEEKYVDSHSAVVDPNHDGKAVTEAISDEDLEMIKKWTIDHAADSEQPMTCG